MDWSDIYTRDQILNILESQLIRKGERINGKLMRSPQFLKFRESVFFQTQCLDDKDDLLHRLVWIKLNYTTPPICKTCGLRTRYRKQTQQFNTFCSPKCVQQDGDVKQKQQQTNLEKYGVRYGCIAPESRQKQLKTNMDRYGVAKPFQSSIIQKKVRDNTLDKYGVVSTALLPEIRKQQIQTRQERYGVDFIFQDKELQNSIEKNTRDKYSGGTLSQRHMIHNLPHLQDRHWMYTEYVINQKSAQHIAHELGSVSGTTVLNYLHSYNIEIRQMDISSYKCIVWLDSIMETKNIHIQHSQNGGEFKIPGTRWKADGFCAETNTIYEFHGDYWHGNPEVFESDVYNESLYKTMGELYQKTIDRETKIKELGYNLVVMWEHSYNTSTNHK